MSGAEGDGKEDDVNQPRQPRNLQDLVRYSIEAGPSQSNESPEEIRRNISPDRRRFLEEALRSFTVDVAKELAEAISTLEKYRCSNDDEDNSAYECALETIAEHVDNIDFANDFCKLGGFDAVPTCLSSDCPGIRWRMCDIVAQCTQNNPFCQANAMKFLEPLLHMVDNDSDEMCQIKAFFAISNIVREYPPALKKFIALDGFSVVMQAMQSKIERLRNKSTFFLSTILSQNPEIIREIYNMGFVEQLVSLIYRDHSPIHEHIISSLLIIAKNYEPALIEFCRPKLRLRFVLKSLLDQYKNDDAFREEMVYVQELLNLVSSNDCEEER